MLQVGNLQHPRIRIRRNTAVFVYIAHKNETLNGLQSVFYRRCSTLVQHLLNSGIFSKSHKQKNDMP